MVNRLTFKHLLCELLLERIDRDVELTLRVKEFCEALDRELADANMLKETSEEEIHAWIIDRLRKLGYTDETTYDDRQLGFPEF